MIDLWTAAAVAVLAYVLGRVGGYRAAQDEERHGRWLEGRGAPRPPETALERWCDAWGRG